METATSERGQWREYRIELKGRKRADGSLFVTSDNLPHFSAILQDGNWDDVLLYLEKFLAANFGEVRELRLIQDASELLATGEPDSIPPAYVIAGLTPVTCISRSIVPACN